jgi:hypothetical protein
MNNDLTKELDYILQNFTTYSVRREPSIQHQHHHHHQQQHQPSIRPSSQSPDQSPFLIPPTNSSIEQVHDINQLQQTLQRLENENKLLLELMNDVKSSKPQPYGYVISDGRNRILFMDNFVRSHVGFTENETLSHWENIVEKDSFAKAHVEVLSQWIGKNETGVLTGLLFQNPRTGQLTKSSHIDIDNYYDPQTGKVLFCTSRIYF